MQKPKAFCYECGWSLDLQPRVMLHIYLSPLVLLRIDMISIVIPARNESAVIARTLRAITTDALPDELDVIVVCNGCTDDTATIARGFGTAARVIETAVGNKTHALNLGDQSARSFPRIYVDAD